MTLSEKQTLNANEAVTSLHHNEHGLFAMQDFFIC